MIKEMKKGVPVWIGVTLYLCYGQAFFTMENITKFLEQFLIVALVGILIVVFQEYVIGWIYDRMGTQLRSFVLRCLVHSLVNVSALYIVLSGIVILDVNRTFIDYLPVYLTNGLLVVGITIAHVVYYTRKFKIALTKKQQNT